MDHHIVTTEGEEWLHGECSLVIEHLERDEYAGVKSMSDEQFLTLQGRMHQDRTCLLQFLPFLDRFILWYHACPAEMRRYEFDRIVMMAPIFRRDALTALPSGVNSS